MCHAFRQFPLVIFLVTVTEASKCNVPKISVTEGVYIDKDKTQYVQEGHTVEIFCSGDAANQLELSDSKTLYSEIVNLTTIRTAFNVSSKYVGLIACRNTCGSDFWSDYKWIQGDYYPKIVNFDCYSENFELLHFTWSTPNNRGKYTLSYVSADGTLITLCRKRMWYKESYICKFDMSNLDDIDEEHPHINVQLEICNYFGCVIEARDYNLLEITKLAAPRKLKMRYFTNAYGEKSIFFHCIPFSNEIVSEMDLYILIEYWLTDIPDMQPRVAIYEKNLGYRRMELNHIVKLPCPSKKYTFRASCRPASAPSKYMSNYAYITFRTNPDPEAKMLDPICKVKPVVETPPVMVYKIQLLRKFIDEEIEKLKMLIKPLQEKAEEIKVEL